MRIDLEQLRRKVAEGPKHPEIADGIIVSPAFLQNVITEISDGREAVAWRARVTRALQRAILKGDAA